MTTELQIANFCDTGFLSNATDEKRTTITVSAMYNRLGSFDPSNDYVKNYKNKDMLNTYRKISEKRQTKANTLLKIYDTIKTIEIRVGQQTSKNKNKSKLK